MGHKENVEQKLRDFLRIPDFVLTGRRISASEVVLRDSQTQPGKVYVRSYDGSYEQMQVWGDASRINQPWRIVKSPSGGYELSAPDWEKGAAVFGTAVAVAYRPPVSEAQPVTIDGNAFKPGRVRANGGLNVYVEPFRYKGGYWAGGDLDLASAVPTGIGAWVWVVVYLDPATSALDYVVGDVSYDPPEISSISDVALPDGVYPLGAVLLRDTSTSLSRASFADARYHIASTSDIGGTSITALIGRLLKRVDLAAANSTIDTGASQIPAGYKYVRILARLRDTDTGNGYTGSVQFNGDATGANYVAGYHYGGAASGYGVYNDGRAFDYEGSNYGVWSFLDFAIEGYDDTSSYKNAAYATKYMIGSASMICTSFALVWKSNAAIDQIALIAGGTNFAAGSWLEVWGYKDETIVGA